MAFCGGGASPFYSADEPFAALVSSARTTAPNGSHPPYLGSPA
jgi:hypothetical protein